MNPRKSARSAGQIANSQRPKAKSFYFFKEGVGKYLSTHGSIQLANKTVVNKLFLRYQATAQ